MRESDAKRWQGRRTCKGDASPDVGVRVSFAHDERPEYRHSRAGENPVSRLWKRGRQAWDSHLRGNEGAFEGGLIQNDSRTQAWRHPVSWRPQDSRFDANLEDGIKQNTVKALIMLALWRSQKALMKPCSGCDTWKENLWRPKRAAIFSC